MRALRRRPSLLTKFSLLSLLVVAAIGIAIGSVLHERIERRALLELALEHQPQRDAEGDDDEQAHDGEPSEQGDARGP